MSDYIFKVNGFENKFRLIQNELYTLEDESGQRWSFNGSDFVPIVHKGVERTPSSSLHSLHSLIGQDMESVKIVFAKRGEQDE